jgi:DMSO/TMAO reductase YedYZ molybdopterin-dependent catalytic subunit
MKEQFLPGITVGFLFSLPWLTLMYAGQRLFAWIHLPFELFEFLSRSLPGKIVTLSIETLIQFVTLTGLGQTSATGKLIEIGLAYLLGMIVLSLLGGLLAVTVGKFDMAWQIKGVLFGSIMGLLSIFLANWDGGLQINMGVNIIWLLSSSFAWGIGLAWGLELFRRASSHEQDADRKRVIGQLAIGSAGLTALAFGLGRWLKPVESAGEFVGDSASSGSVQATPTPPPARAGFEPVAGTRPEITPIEDFYRVDINLLPPGDADFLSNEDPMVFRLLQQGGETDLPADSYVLVVDGLVENPLTLTLEDIKTFPAVEQYGTLTCISNPVGGDLIGTTLFQGARLRDVLETAQLDPQVLDIKFTGVDGYTESLPLEAALDAQTLLCYNMGGQPLTRTHGSPLRVYTPNRYGIKNPKWIIRIEAVDSDYQGFWQQRGWTENGFIKTTSVIDTTQTGSGEKVMVGGIAFSGARGINAVELRVNEGDWIQAELDRPLSRLTWVLWRAGLEMPAGEHTITVRAIDGNGEVQIEKRSGTQPDGATGYHSVTITV